MGGYHLLFRFRIAEAKEEMKKELLSANKDEVTRLVFSAGEMEALHWEDESEFQYKNEMYDVLKVEQDKAQIIIWCISDKKETTLIDQYLAVNKQSSEKNTSGTFLKLLTAQFLPSKEVVLPSPNTIYQQNFPHYLCKIPIGETGIPVPPPKGSGYLI